MLLSETLLAEETESPIPGDCEGFLGPSNTSVFDNRGRSGDCSTLFGRTPSCTEPTHGSTRVRMEAWRKLSDENGVVDSALAVRQTHFGGAR
jgi:hypothetical protein